MSTPSTYDRPDAASPDTETPAPRWRLTANTVSWLGLYATLAAAWVAIWAMDPVRDLPPELRSLGVDALAAICLAAARDASFLGLWAMWATMGAAMMLPTAVPALHAFARLSETIAARDPAAASALALPALAAGYLAIWAGFAVVAALGQIMLSGAGFLGPGGDVIASPGIAAALLLAAGLWQFTALKDACLRRCRNPMTQFMAAWRPGAPAAFRMGLGMGADCLGCCWALMLLAFVGGTSNLLFMGCATLLMILEKLPEIGRPLTKPVGFGLICAGTVVAVNATVM